MKNATFCFALFDFIVDSGGVSVGAVVGGVIGGLVVVALIIFLVWFCTRDRGKLEFDHETKMFSFAKDAFSFVLKSNTVNLA